MSITTVRSSVFALVLLVAAFVLLPSFAHADTELLTNNPGFETVSGTPATPTGWSHVVGDPGVYSVVSDAHAGTEAGSVVVSTITAGQEAKWLTPAIAVSAGQVINFTDWYKSNILTSVFVYPNGSGAVTWIGDAATSSAAYMQFHGQSYLVPPGVTSIQLGHAIDHKVGATASTLTTDDYSVMLSSAPSEFAKGIVTLTFDDGWDSFYNLASSSLTAHGLNTATTNYIITGIDGSNVASLNNPNSVTGTNGPNQDYMSAAQILDLKAHGFDIEDHTTSHIDLAKDLGTPANPTAVWTAEITNSIAALNHLLNPSNIAGQNVDSFAYPYGSYCAPTLSDCVNATSAGAGIVNVLAPVKAAPGIIGARSVDQGYNLASDLTSDNVYKLKMQQVNNTATAADVEAWINYARDNKVWLILMFHNVRPASTSTTPYIDGAQNPACIEDVTDANGNPVVPHQTAADPDCTTQEVLDATTAYVAAQEAATPSISALNMKQVLTSQVPPVIAPHADVYAQAVASTSAIVTYTAPLVTPSGTASCSPTSGSIFNIGSTTVNCTFAGAGPTTFTVGVTAHVAPVATSVATSTIVAIATPITLLATGTGTLNFTTTVPKFGTLSGTGANLIYTPQASTTAFTDSFTFKVNDGLLDSNVATATISVTLAPDVTAPQITSISSGSPGQNAATITWTTDENSNSTVVYGGDSNYGATTTDATMTTSHSISLSSLATHTTYHFMVISSDASGNTATSSDQTFTTADVQQSSGGGGGGCSGCGCGGCGGGGGGVVVGLIGQVNGGQVLGTSTQALTDAQINAILNLLKSFNADQSVIDNVSNALHGIFTGSTGSTTGKYFFTKTLVLGSKNDDVTALQNLFTTMDIYSGPVTGTFGPLTSAATKTYQTKNGITPTGTVGPLTRASLNQ